MHADLPSFRISSSVASVGVEVRLADKVRRILIRMREEGKGGEGVSEIIKSLLFSEYISISVYIH